jgi:hypothetical protein
MRPPTEAAYLRNAGRHSNVRATSKSRRVQICRDQQSPGLQRLLQLADCVVPGRPTVGTLHVLQERLQRGILVSNDPPAGKHLGLVEARYPDR